MLREGDTFAANGCFGEPEKKFSHNFNKENKKIFKLK